MWFKRKSTLEKLRDAAFDKFTTRKDQSTGRKVAYAVAGVAVLALLGYKRGLVPLAVSAIASKVA